MKIDLKAKFTSRKFLAMLVGLITGLAMAFGLDEGIISMVTGAVTSVASVIAYILTEGKIDAERVKTAAMAVQDIANILGLGLGEYDTSGGDIDD